MEIDVYGLAAPQFSTCQVTLHEHYNMQPGQAISMHGAPNPCYDDRNDKWRSSTSLFYDDVHECEDACDADKHCIGFVHNLQSDPACKCTNSSYHNLHRNEIVFGV